MCCRHHCGCGCGHSNHNCGCHPQPVCGWEWVCHRPTPLPLASMEEAVTSLGNFCLSEESSGCGCGRG